LKVLIIQLPHFYEETGRTATTYPLGIGYLVSVLKDIHETLPLDLFIDNFYVDDALRLIEKNPPDVFCISVYSTQYPFFIELVRRLKERYPSTPTIAGGPGATFSYDVFLNKTKIDYCVLGEGEITLKELLDNMDAPGDVNGIAFRKENELILTKPRRQIKDLDTLPLPDRTFFDFERYIENSQKHHNLLNNLRCNNVITSRGCPYNCTFCSKTFSGSRMRSVESIDTEIRFLKNEYGLEAIEFDDELVLINKRRALKICEMMKKHSVIWGCQGRINVVDKEVLHHMKDSGCKYIGYGVESYTQKILDNMRKEILIEQIIPVIKMTKRIGIEPVIQYMYGYPGEDDSSIEASYRFFKEIDHPYIGMVTTPLPGTPLYQDALAKNKIIDEEAYLMKLTSGYNYSKPLANLTAFTDMEFVKKRRALQRRVNTAYYIKHPTAFFGHFFKNLFQRAALLFKDPSLFFKKAMSKAGSLIGK